jgi:DNA-binding transcriptional LysR family regulator
LDNISHVDLNLLLVLYTLIDEASAPRAAERLRVTPAAVSGALTRLRAIFGDELLVPSAGGLAPTPRAVALRPRLRALLLEAAAVFVQPTRFDPATSTREFSLACADYYGTVVVPSLVARLRERAPGVTLRVRTLDELASDHGLDRDTDVHIGIPPKMPSGCLFSELFDDRFVCLQRRGRGKRRLTLEAFLAASHVRVSVLGRGDPVDVLLEAQGLSRSVALVVPYFTLVPFVVHETGLLATMSERLALAYAGGLPLELSDPPLELSPYGVRMIWHRRTNKDEGARFFRGVLKDAMSGVLPSAASRQKKGGRSS